MKEEAPSKKLPPKMFGGCTGAGPSSTSLPTKVANDEILSTLLRINNFDSISSIKDDSLDIDLSACVTINTDPAGMISMGGSLSSTDFWRMLDESAQQQLEMSTSLTSTSSTNDADGSDNCTEARPPHSFSGTFLRPEPPTLAVSPFSSPLKKYVVVKSMPAAAEPPNNKHQRQRVKTPATHPLATTLLSLSLSSLESKKSKVSYAAAIKEEPPEQLLADPPSPPPPTRANSANTTNPADSPAQSISVPSAPHCFSVFMLTKTPTTTTTPTTATPATATITTTTAAAASAQNPPALFQSSSSCGITVLENFSVHEAAAAPSLLPHKCGECERDFEQEAGLKKHLKTHRSMEARKDAWKKCPDCGKCLKLGSMWMHRKIHSDNKKYGCDICGQKFVQKINLTHHSRVHTAEKPYECPECQKRFQERSHLQRHQKYHAQTRSYRCEKCGKMYKTERCLKVHNLVHLEQRPFACNVCDKSFISNSKLKQHSNIHTGERPFKCNYCPRDFTNFPNWLKHTRRRHKVDHKTGEHLEFIPSYCSKKSAKTPKVIAASPLPLPPPTTTTTVKLISPEMTKMPQLEQASNAATTTATAAVAAAPAEATIYAGSGKAPPVRRKKKVAAPPLEMTAGAGEHLLDHSVVAVVGPATTGSVACTNPHAAASVAPPSAAFIKAPKVKRERKQLQPKQVQKSPHAVPVAQPAPPLLIKKELPEPNLALKPPQLLTTSVNSFPDLHCLSITSAEDLIMEQALEMEECGLYDAPSSSVDDTDNAISSEAAAALHFKIKNEFGVDQEEEFISLNEVKNRVLCSSLESSPFSSPASIDLTSSAAVSTLPPALTAISAAVTSTAGVTTFYMPSFTVSSQGTLVTKSSSGGGGGCAMRQTNATVANTAREQLSTAQQTHHGRHLPSTQTQALINHLYLPMMPVVGGIMPLQPNQALPSVDTLLFSSAHASANSFFHGKGQAATAQHNMS